MPSKICCRCERRKPHSAYVKFKGTLPRGCCKQWLKDQRKVERSKRGLTDQQIKRATRQNLIDNGKCDCTRCGKIKPTAECEVDKNGRPLGLCTSCDRKRRKDNILAKPEKYVISQLLRDSKLSAKKRGQENTLKIEDIIVPERCPVLGIKLKRIIGTMGGPRDFSPSLDRIDNTRGYHADNIVVVSWRANRLKSDGNVDEHYRIAKFYGALNLSRYNNLLRKQHGL